MRILALAFFHNVITILGNQLYFCLRSPVTTHQHALPTHIHLPVCVSILGRTSMYYKNRIFRINKKNAKEQQKQCRLILNSMSDYKNANLSFYLRP